MKPFQYLGILVVAFAGGFVADFVRSGGAVSAQNTDVIKAKAVEAESIAVKDKDGRTYAILGASGLRILDAYAKDTANCGSFELSIDKSSHQPCFEMNDSTGELRAALKVRNTNQSETSFDLYPNSAPGTKGMPQINFLLDSQSASLCVTKVLGESAKMSVTPTANAGVPANFEITDAKSKLLWQALPK